MYTKLTPRDNEWNRKYDFTDEKSVGFLLDVRLGQVFWAWKFSNEEVRFFKCETEVFHKNFSVENQKIEHEFDPFDSPHFLRYPIEQ